MPPPPLGIFGTEGRGKCVSPPSPVSPPDDREKKWDQRSFFAFLPSSMIPAECVVCCAAASAQRRRRRRLITTVKRWREKRGGGGGLKTLVEEYLTTF